MERGVNNFLILSLDFVAEKLPLKVNEWESGGSHFLTVSLSHLVDSPFIGLNRLLLSAPSGHRVSIRNV